MVLTLSLRLRLQIETIMVQLRILQKYGLFSEKYIAMIPGLGEHPSETWWLEAYAEHTTWHSQVSTCIQPRQLHKPDSEGPP